MTATPRTLDRTRSELSDFLRQRRERLSPLEAGLPPGTRRRTPGLRREEVAALAGVGLTWYTWFEQGRDITVSASFLENVARVLRLDETERRHLFVLAHQRPPAGSGGQWCEASPLARRLLDDLTLRPAYIMNLRWDVLAWNDAADRVFSISGRPNDERNMLWMLFADTRLSRMILEWQKEAPQVLASFRRDFAQVPNDEAMLELVETLERVSPEFRILWKAYTPHVRCRGLRSFMIDGIGTVIFDHSTFIVDEERHLRLVFYAANADDPQSAAFETSLKS